LEVNNLGMIDTLLAAELQSGLIKSRWRNILMNQRPSFVRRLIVVALVLVPAAATVTHGQTALKILAGPELNRVVPSSFYFKGLTAPTQMRNSAAARLGEDRYVIAGLVDTSGYAADVRARYEGFLITDSPITINGMSLEPGAYGFGFSNDGKLNILALNGKEILSVQTTRDSVIKRPRPLMMTTDERGCRFYNGRDYAIIAFK
jgi:hypothetical protein